MKITTAKTIIVDYPRDLKLTPDMPDFDSVTYTDTVLSRDEIRTAEVIILASDNKRKLLKSRW